MYQIMLNNEVLVDNFAGGGGASLGVEMALQRPVNVAINHDPDAVAMHTINHPNTTHLCEDVWKVSRKDIIKLLAGRKIAVAWFSPDCKHFSKAKGSKPVSKKIRGLANIAHRYSGLPDDLKPRIICLENVEEFITWGPLMGKGADQYPDPAKKGLYFEQFVQKLRAHGYKVEWRELKACDYGTPTIRKRFFLIARSDGEAIVWPKPTHGKKGSGLKPYRTAAECIDWSLPCPSIFSRKKPLAENTMRRIAKGIDRYVKNAAEPFIVKVNHTYDQFRGQELTQPFTTITAKNGYAVVTPYLTEHSNGSSQRNFDAQEPLRTQCAQVKGGHFALVAPTLVQTGYGESQAVYHCPSCEIDFKDKHASGLASECLAGAECPECGDEKSITVVKRAQEPRALDLQKPLGTVVAGGGKHALVMPLLVGAGGPEGAAKPAAADAPLGTVLPQNHRSLCTAFLAKHLKSSAGVAMPLAKKGNGPNHLMSSHIMKMRGENVGHGMNEPLHTITASGKHHAEVRAFLLKYYGNEEDGHSLNSPLGTVTTRDRFGLVTIQGEDYEIVDIGMRMLTPRELYRAQGFPDSYVIDRGIRDGQVVPLTKEAQVRMCGNSVCPPLAQAIVAANMAQSQVFAAHG